VEQGVHECVDREREELANHDHQLIDGHHAAAAVRRRHLRQIHRNRSGRSADRYPEHNPSGQHDAERRR
jgi:hypothetical protein